MSKEVPAIQKVKFQRVMGSIASDDLLNECASLFSKHYGKWGNKGVRPGHNIQLTAGHLKEYLPEKLSWIATARLEGELIGYGMAAVSSDKGRTVTWVTQLIVHTDHQNKLIGSKILHSMWGFSNHFAWGIASANPFAIRALEKATKRRCSFSYMMRSVSTVNKILSGISYLKDHEKIISDNKCIIDTKFMQDLSNLPEKLASVRKKMPWSLGDLREGEEWLGVTFRDQDQERWDSRELESFLSLSDEIVMEAYDRMAQADPQRTHGWARPEHAEEEITYLQGVMELTEGSRVLDIGCGSGRHAVALAKKGFFVHGVDFSKTFIESAQSYSKLQGVGEYTKFSNLDFRQAKFDEIYDATICLYDVVGSSPEDQLNEQLIERAITHTKSGGWIIISVMSYEYTEGLGPNLLEKRNLDEAINELPASNIMQSSGDVFDPNYMLVDEKRKVVYRKEQFDLGDEIPIELIVRDRRYTSEDLHDICKRFGLTLYACGHVSAGNFALVEDVTSPPTRELLLIAKKGVA